MGILIIIQADSRSNKFGKMHVKLDRFPHHRTFQNPSYANVNCDYTKGHKFYKFI